MQGYRTALFVLVGGLLSATSAQAIDAQFAAAQQANIAQCQNRKAPPNARIPACSAVLDGGRASGKITNDEIAKFLYYRGLAHAIAKQHDKALADLDDALTVTPKNIKVLYLKGITQVDGHKSHHEAIAGRYAAIKTFTSIIELNPKHAWAYFRRGDAYFFVDKLEWAIRDFDEAVKLLPNSVHFLSARAEVLALRGEYRKALTDLDNILAKQAQNEMALGTKAMILLSASDSAIRDTKQAITLATQAYITKPVDRNLRVLGLAYAADNQMDASVSLFENALKKARPIVVAQYQKHLRYKGFYNGAFDGVFSPEMQEALRSCLKELCLKLY